jgi:TonB family protein
MAMKTYPGRMTFGLLPEPEGRSASFVTATLINGAILATLLILGVLIRPAIEAHKYEETVLIMPTKQPPPPPVKIKIPPPPPPPEVKPLEVKLETPKIEMPKIKPIEQPKPIQMEAMVKPLPTVKAARPSIILAPQPKAALTAAMPAQNNTVKASTAPVHLGETFGVTPNPNATRPATVAAIGNPYGGMNGPAVAPHGVVGSTGIGNGLRSGSNAGVVGKVAQAGIPGGTGTSPTGYAGGGKVASANIPGATSGLLPQVAAPAAPTSTQVEVSIPRPEYTQEAKTLKIQGTVVLRVTFYANGQIQVLGVLRGLGHGLDEEAKRAVQQGKVIKPATRDGKAMDSTTNITITFQLA